MDLLNNFMDQMILAHREGVAVNALHAMLIEQDVSEDEVSLILDILALESKKKNEKNNELL